MQCRRARITQKRKRPGPDQRWQNRGSTDTAISDRSRILHPTVQPLFSLLDPTAVNRLEALWFGENLGWRQMCRAQFVLRKITSARSQIGTGIAQDIDQLECHAVTFPERHHLIFA